MSAARNRIQHQLQRGLNHSIGNGRFPTGGAYPAHPVSNLALPQPEADETSRPQRRTQLVQAPWPPETLLSVNVAGVARSKIDPLTTGGPAVRDTDSWAKMNSPTRRHSHSWGIRVRTGAGIWSSALTRQPSFHLVDGVGQFAEAIEVVEGHFHVHAVGGETDRITAFAAGRDENLAALLFFYLDDDAVLFM